MKYQACTLALLGLGVVLSDIPDARADAEAYCRKRYLGDVTAIDSPARHLNGLRQGAGRAVSPPHVAMPAPAPAAPVVTGPAQEQAAADRAAKSVASSWRPEARPLQQVRPEMNRDRYPGVTPNGIHVVAEDPVSTFSADVDTAAWAVARRHILHEGRVPPADAVRPEEFVNAFDYAYPIPGSAEEGFRPDVALLPAPWNGDRHLLRIGVKGYALTEAERPAANLVFLLDVSGSMGSADKLPLARTSICMLVHELKADDRIAMVVYAGAAGVALEPTPVERKAEILDAMDRLEAGGSTAGGQGIELAYALAEANFRAGAANRIVLATDGDFNVGIADPRHLRDYVARKRDTGIFLTVLGYGMGNYSDEMMQALAQSGNGVAAYIDSVDEARRVLVRGLTGSVFTIARDVKFQVEFNPARVAEYRLIGYETRLLDRADFGNDRVDAGDVGSGHTVTALYEIALAGTATPSVEPLRYGPKPAPAVAGTGGELAVVRLRFKAPGSDTSRLIERPVTEADMVGAVDDAPADARFAAAVAWFAEALRNSPHVPADWSTIRSLADGATGPDRFGDRHGFVDVVRASERVAAVD
ncbi:MAG: von Willebrand factor type A domain-containing protein [Pseudomonadota bacterium]|nr:von Willebrand factor type A domain-containing protein [Pseudomonadota bacterium]